MKIFSKDEINLGRQFEPDMAKFICIVGMVLVHCFEIASGEEYSLDVSMLEYILVNVLDTIFGAGTFMLCMGFGIAYGREVTGDYLIKRGAKIMLIGYILQMIRELPTLYYGLNVYLFWVFEVDILIFAGVALMLYGVLKKLKLSDLAIMGVGVALSVIGSFVGTVYFDNPYMVDLAGIFIGAKMESEGIFYYSYFPLINWFIFVPLGNMLGKIYKTIENKKKFYLIFSGIAFAVIFTYMAICIPNKIGICGEIENFYHLNTISVFICFCGSVFAFGLYYAISGLLGEKVKSFITRVSVLINKIYCAHWIIMNCSVILLWTTLQKTSYRDEMVIAWSAVIFVLSYIVADFIDKKQKKKAKK